TTTPIVITFSGLSAGTYSMEVLSGLYGGNWIGGNLKFAFSGEGTDTSKTDWSSSIVNKGDNGVWHTSATATDSSSLTCPTLRGQGGKQDQGALVNASDIIVSENGTLTLTISSDSGAYPINVINNIILTKNDQSVPEASTATLSLLALAGLMLRRRRN
ncbi:MAG: PEP-CTERM sorting domain-containing protein, partial [Akkermansia sp.]